jgi:hypothetical protein
VPRTASVTNPFRVNQVDQDQQKPAEVTSEPDVETSLDDTDLDVVVGGLISRGGAIPDDGGCITSVG